MAGETAGNGNGTGSQNANGDAEKTTAQRAAGTKAGAGDDAIALLKQDHRNVEALFDKFEKARGPAQKKKLVAQIVSEFLTHSLIEERIFYPACREKIADDQLDEAQVEHDSAKQLVGELRDASPEEPFYDAKVKVLGEYIRHHVAEEEQPGDGIMDAASAAGVDIAALGKEIEARREEFRRQVEQRPPDMPSMGKMHKEQIMAQQDRRSEYGRSSTRYADDDDDRRGSNARYQERDEYGRFVSEDHRGGSGRGGGSRGYDRERDDEGRFMSRGGGRDRDEDDRRGGGGRGHGGWFGDSEGHAEAARRGWDEREGGSRGRGDDNDRRYSSYSRSNGGGRYRDDDDDRRGGGRGHGGWFGDPEGHSEASRRGWDEREGRSRGRDDDDDRYSSRARSGSRYRDDDDDDDRRGRGHGGWFGDPRGHSEAARRGWDHR